MDITTNILTGNFELAEEIFCNKNYDDISESIISYAFDNPSITFYDFANYLANKQNNALYHYFAAELLVTALSHTKNATQNAYSHTKKAIKLEPNNLVYKDFIRFFYKNPNI